MITKEIELKTPHIFNSPYIILDTETKNDLALLKWNYLKADIICFGFILNSKIIIYLREKGDNIEDYKKLLINSLDKLNNLPSPLYSFNQNMEAGSFEGFLGKKYAVEEIMAFKGRGKNKNWFFEDLMKDNLIDFDFFGKDLFFDPFQNSGEVMDAYEKEEYDKIIQHNIADLIKEYFILDNRKHFLKKYNKNIDKNGWFVENS